MILKYNFKLQLVSTAYELCNHVRSIWHILLYQIFCIRKPAFCFCPLGFPKENLQCNNKKTQGEDPLKSEGLKMGRCPGDQLRCPGDQLRRRFCRKKPRRREQRRPPPHNLDNSATWSTILVSFNFNVFNQ